ncbi:hypothetical protein [Bradyrhizobium sp. OAE829]|uniref:hypothetical protein n=1 Tax=Bradyrhizobium sp. OAE829 TaxID=2663807 RepID=UPI00178A5786
MNWQGSKPCPRRIGSGLPDPVRFAFWAGVLLLGLSIECSGFILRDARKKCFGHCRFDGGHSFT